MSYLQIALELLQWLAIVAIGWALNVHTNCIDQLQRYLLGKPEKLAKERAE